MAFFSRLKKLWKGEEEQESPPQVPDVPVESNAAPAPEAATAPPPEAPPTPEPVSPPVAPETIPAPEPVPDAGKPAEKPEAWKQELIRALQKAEPKLSIWIMHILNGVDTAGPELWQRLRFLFDQLEAPKEEAEDFIARFERWLEDMEYERVEEFRSELQYRMALALELEDEEDERDRLFLKLSTGLAKTREQLSLRIDQLLDMNSAFDDEFWEEFEEILIMADVGVSTTQKLLTRLRTRVRKENVDTPEGFKTVLRQELASLFKEPKPVVVKTPPEVVVLVGVNGVGKTTTIAKLAHRAQMQGKKVLLAAGDTFRAAAIQQLDIWSKRVGAGFYAKEYGSDPAAVAFEALDDAVKGGYDMIFMDTAGRLHTKTNLMEELKKVIRVMKKKIPDAPHRTILVVDATTGQNALSQVQLFSEAIPIDEVILTKLDGTAKGGMIVAIAMENDLPISYIGLGEKMEDLRPFSGEDFSKALLD
ncbi:MAG: signal recognition particle-docking protein FtsY [Desulfovibrionales bacterium]